MTEESNIPEELSYSEEHEWIRVEGDDVVVGITDYAQGELHDVVFAELPEVGTTVEAGGKLAVLETMKAVADVFAPVSGEVSAVNTELDAAPELINADAYGKGWIVRITPSDLDGDKAKLMDAAGYKEFINK